MCVCARVCEMVKMRRLSTSLASLLKLSHPNGIIHQATNQKPGLKACHGSVPDDSRSECQADPFNQRSGEGSVLQGPEEPREGGLGRGRMKSDRVCERERERTREGERGGRERKRNKEREK